MTSTFLLPSITQLPGVPEQISNIKLPLQGLIEANEIESKPKQPSLKIKFTQEEDYRLYYLVHVYGCKNWNQVASMMVTRNPRQCRERWNNYLNPNLRHDQWSPEEDMLLMQKYKELGTKWRKISLFFHNRSDNALRNRLQLLERRFGKIGEFSSTDNNSSDLEK